MRFFIGDVHGCALELELMIKRIHQLDSHPEIIAVGDLINKGPQSIEVLEIVKSQHIQCIQGNHEAAFLRIYHTPEDVRTEKEQKFISRFQGKEAAWAPFISTWPYWLEWDDILCIHAGVDPGVKNLENMNKRTITTIRTWDGLGANLDNPLDKPWFETIQWPKKIVFGHWAMRGLVNEFNVVGLDTGCVYGGQLTAWCPETNEFIQIQAQKQYALMAKD